MHEGLAELLRHGSDLLKARKPDRARSTLEQAYTIDPRDPKVRNLLGLAYFKLGLLEAAKSIYDGLVLDYPEEAPLFVNLGLVLLRQGRLEDAEVALTRALALAPSHSRAHCYLGLVMYRRGELAQARHHFVLGEAHDFARKVQQRLSKDDGQPSRSELLRGVADDGVAGLAKSDAFRSVDADKNGASDEEGWEESIAHSQPPLPVPELIDEEPLSIGSLSVALDLPSSMAYGMPGHGGGSSLPEISIGGEAIGFTAGPGARARLEIETAGYVKPSAIVAATGRLTMSEAKRHFNNVSTGGVFGEPADPMCRIEGRTALVLRVKKVAVALRGARDLHVVQRALVGFEDGFSWDNGRILGLDVVTLRGRGSLLLDADGAPMLLQVEDDTPVHAASDALLAWSDGVRPSPLEPQSQKPRLFKVFGRGYVLVQVPADEDGSLGRSSR